MGKQLEVVQRQRQGAGILNLVPKLPLIIPALVILKIAQMTAEWLVYCSAPSRHFVNVS